MKIGIITYDVPHKKTQDVLLRLKAYGYDNVECIALPFIERKKFIPLIIPRSTKPMPIAPEKFCNNLGYSYTRNVDLSQYDKILIGGANILPKELIGEYEIINAHPGYLPIIRGLDSLKWAVLDGLTIGVTTHIINEDIDSGYMIDRIIVSKNHTDTIHSLANKVYLLELIMLVDALTNLNREEMVNIDNYTVHRKMPHETELKMIMQKCGFSN